MFDNLSQSINKAWKMVQKDGKLTPENMKEPMKEIRRALLEADVSLPVVRRFVKKIEEKALGVEVLDGVSPDVQFVKVSTTAGTCDVAPGCCRTGCNHTEV